MRRWAGALVVAAALPACGAGLDRSAAEHALLQGRVDDAARILRQQISANPSDGAAHLLLCRTFYAEDLPDEAVEECEAAVGNGLGQDSRAQDWMGRAYGKKADGAGRMTGLKLAFKVKSAFEAAVQLDPANAAAVNDLSEYYVGAPAIVGGGLDRAMALAARVEARLPQPAHRIRALAAEKRNDTGTAEREFRAAVGVAGRPDAWTDLGDFYARQGRGDEAVAALRKALDADTARDATLVDVASVLESLHREPQMAERALSAYLASNAKSDAAPAFKAHDALGRLLAARGDRAGAKLQYAAALALNSHDAEARRALAAF